MYGIEYEDDILLLLRMIKFLHMQSPDAAHIFCQSHPVVDMEELLMVIDEVMWDIFDDVNFFFDEEYEATVVQCSHPIIDRLYEQGRASDPKHGSRQSVWSKKLHDIEAVKGGLSDSMKRAAVQWGIGRVLYDLNTVWVEIEKRGRSFVIKDSERAKLDNAYLSALKRLGLTPAAACGIQSLLTPKTLPGQTAPEENAPAASPQPKQGNSQPAPASALQRADQPATRSDSQQTQPVQQSRAAASRTVPFALPQSAARQRTDCYVVLSTKVQGGMSGSSTLVTLRAPDGKQIPAFARGARPELSTGTVLSNVKLTMRQQDTVAFYVLESYKIVPQEDRAA